MPSITKIVITGGPCAGKTTAMSWLQNAFTSKGYTVLFVPETATELIGGGVAPWTCGTNLDYQKCQVRLQMVKEELFQQAAGTMPGEKILIVCDRGELDNKAYMTDQEFAIVCAGLGTTEVALRDGYDAVFHLVTAARGASEAYTLTNNAARTETPEQAIALDDKLISAWTGHPHLRIIDNATDFSTKMKRLITEVSAFLGEPEPFAIERKYLIRYPDLAWLEGRSGCKRFDITQTYLRAPEGTQIRVRHRSSEGGDLYYKTTRRTLPGQMRIEQEKRLTRSEYLNALVDADPALRQLCKRRYCLAHNGHCFKIDLFPFWEDQAILELELSHAQERFTLPEEITVLREVTGLPEFMNISLAAGKTVAEG